MDKIELVNLYRKCDDLESRLRLAKSLHDDIAEELSAFLFRRVPSADFQDVFQEVMVAIFNKLDTFKGHTDKKFWSWCYQIARHKVSDHYRKESANPVEAWPPDQLCILVEAVSARFDKSRPQVRLDLEYAMNLLGKANPKCRDLLWEHYVFGFNCAEIAEEFKLKYDAVRRRIERCLKTARALIAT